MVFALLLISRKANIVNRREIVFPEYYYSFLHFYIAALSDPFFAAESPNHHVFLSNRPKVTIADADAKIDRIYFDFHQIAVSLNLGARMDSNVCSSQSISVN